MTEPPLTSLQLSMLEVGKFHLDGSTTARAMAASEDLLRRGYVTRFESGSDEAQYTAYNYTVTPAGKAALAASRHQGE